MRNQFILLVSGVAALGGLLFGFDTAIISGAIPAITTYFNLDSAALGGAVSSVLIGCAIGALFAGRLSNSIGRRGVLLLCAILFAISGIGTGVATSFSFFVACRILGGLAVGAAAMVSPMYIAEMAPAAKRGSLVSLYQLAIVIGIVLAYLTGYLLGEKNWRWMFASQALPSAIFFALLILVPETPRWLASKGQKEKALEILFKVDPNNATSELTAIEQSFENKEVTSIWKKQYRTLLIAGAGLAIFQQITGINAILYYAPLIFRETGLDTSDALLQTVGLGLVNVLAAVAAIVLIDRLGRRKLLLSGSLIMGLSLFGLATCFHFQYFSNYIVLILVLVYVAAFGCTLGAVTWVYLSEMFPNRIRGKALSFVTLTLWIADLLVAASFPIMNNHLGTAITLSIYATFCMLALLFIYMRLPETSGRSLENIEQLFISNHE